MNADLATVRALIDDQFPPYRGLPLTPITPGGWDNRSFRLGEDMVVRLPSAAHYAPQIAREGAALPVLVHAGLPAAITQRLHQGEAGNGYPFDWVINRWIAGAPAAGAKVCPEFSDQLGRFLAALHHVDPAIKLPPASGNFHRGGSLSVYADEVMEALARLGNAVLRRHLEAQWERALLRPYSGPPRWVHGDVFPWNLLVDPDGNLCGVIDWGLVATGDPACDYALAWTCFEPDWRGALRQSSGVDDAMWDRARGWSLWKAATLATGVNSGTPDDIAASHAVLERIAADR